MEKSYGHFVSDIGGRNSIKKDHQLESWINDSSFQESNIQNFLKPFSDQVLSQAFTLQPGILPGFDSSVWVAEEGGPKKKRKKRKQAEMLAGPPIQPSIALNPHPQLAAHHPSPLLIPASSSSLSSPHPSTTHQPGRSNRSIEVSIPTTHPQSQLQSHPSLNNSPQVPQHSYQQPPQQNHHHTQNSLCREEDHRKKKRTKLNAHHHSSHPSITNPSIPNPHHPHSTNSSNTSNHKPSGKPSAPSSTSTRHQVALQSYL